MFYIKEPEDVDFVINEKPLTDKQKKKISEFIEKDKKERRKNTPQNSRKKRKNEPDRMLNASK